MASSISARRAVAFAAILAVVALGLASSLGPAQERKQKKAGKPIQLEMRLQKPKKLAAASFVSVPVTVINNSSVNLASAFVSLINTSTGETVSADLGRIRKGGRQSKNFGMENYPDSWVVYVTNEQGEESTQNRQENNPFPSFTLTIVDP
jgi:hypothetical protein